MWQEDEVKLGWEVQAGQRLCGRSGRSTAIRFGVRGAMMTRLTFVISSKLTGCRAVLLTLTLVAMASTVSGQQVKRSSGSDAPRIGRTAPADTAALAARRRFLEMFARAFFPGRTGQLLIVPR